MSKSHHFDELKAYIQAQGWHCQPGKPIPHGEQIIVTAEPHQATVNFYPKRGKLVAGGPDSSLKVALIAWINGESPPNASSLPPTGTRLDALKQFAREQGWNWEPGADIPYGEQIVVFDAGVTALVNFWPKRGKMQVQGPDSPLKAALQAWVAGKGGSTAPTAITGPHIGMDESGKGDWFGPLVVAAVYVDEQTSAALCKVGVRDSKTLPPRRYPAHCRTDRAHRPAGPTPRLGHRAGDLQPAVRRARQRQSAAGRRLRPGCPMGL